MIRASNFYKIEGVEYTRVTRVTGMIPKQNFLIKWAARITAEEAAKIDQSEYQTASVFAQDVMTASEAARVVNRDRGTEIHGAIEAHVDGEKVLDKFKGWVDQADQVLEQYIDQRHMDTEMVLVNVNLGYAGTCDVSAGNVILDWKTGVRLYTDYLIQMWAYMEATHWYDPDSDTLQEIEVKPTLGILARLEEHANEIQTLEADTNLYNLCGETFAHLQGVKAWTDNERKIW